MKNFLKNYGMTRKSVGWTFVAWGCTIPFLTPIIGGYVVLNFLGSLLLVLVGIAIVKYSPRNKRKECLQQKQ